MHEVNYDADKIKLAVDIVENFKLKLDDTRAVSGNKATISVETLEEINKEFSSYVSQKHVLIKILKDFSDKMNTEINNIKFPVIERILAKFFTSSNPLETTCRFCMKSGLTSILKHYRYCEEYKKCEENKRKSQQDMPPEQPDTVESPAPTPAPIQQTMRRTTGVKKYPVLTPSK
jgi:hypothetical protein